jgi:predicted nucleotidyltransferase
VARGSTVRAGTVQAELEAILGTKVDLVPKQAFGAVARFYATH